MENLIEATTGVDSIRAVLTGGPASIPETSRIQAVGPYDEKIKIPHHGGYEHFERASELAGNVSVQDLIFRWTARTEIAE